MKLLLTSSGITNTSIYNALIGLLGKPIEECNALLIPTAIYPFPNGANMAWQAICGKTNSLFARLGWQTLGVLELTALPSIEKEIWLTDLKKADALLVWGGDPLFLSYWLHQTGLVQLLPSLLEKMVYVGVSAGSMSASALFGETYTNPPHGSHNALSKENLVFQSPQGNINRTFMTAHGAGLVDFALIPHYNNPNHPDASLINAEKWAAKLSVPVYAIDDQTAIQVNDQGVKIISEGSWKLFNG